MPASPPDLPQRGFSYIEVLLSAVLLAVLVVPALQALQSGIRGGVTPELAARQPALSAKMEEVLARPFPDLYAQTYSAGNTTQIDAKFSDDAAASKRRVVVLYRYDPAAQALSNNDTGLLLVRVYYEAEGSGNALNTLAGRWW